jgi:alpha/beta superfamily hydrolase
MPPPSPPDALVVESVRFDSGPYWLEGELAYPEAALPTGAVLLAGPHPLLGGHMHNNVMRGLGDGLARRGFVTLRFNYRGVCGSEGPPLDTAAHLARFWETSRVPDEAHHQDDLAAALDFLRSVAGDHLPLALVGYSYGCSLLPGVASGVASASRASTRGADAAPLALIAPTVGTHNYGGFDAVTNPKLVVAPEGDFAAVATRLLDWFDGLREPKRLLQPRLDSHFFRGHEEWLTATVAAFFDGQGAEPA